MPHPAHHSSQVKPDIDPHLLEHVRQVFKEEFQALASLVRFQWPLLLLLLAGIGGLLYVAQPLPPTKIRVAAGQPDSSLDFLSKKYAANFAKNGIELELVQTAGALENAQLLRAGKVDAAFSLGGMVDDDGSGMVSLGSVEYQPFWVFYRGADFASGNPTEFFMTRTLSINIPGSGTHSMSQKILAMHGVRIEGNPRIVSLSSAQSVDALRAGKIDGMLLVAGVESGTIKRLLDEPGIRVLDLAHADTYRNKVKYLEAITLPRGGLDLGRDLPPDSKRLVATTTTLLTTNALHPSLQHLFLDTAKKIDQEGDAFFTRPGGFPARTQHDIALSKVAERFYEKGPPFLHGYVTFWIATFFGELGVITLAVLAIAFPLVRIVPRYRLAYANLCMTDFYEELKALDRQLREVTTPSQAAMILAQFDQMQKRVLRLWVPTGANESFYNLRVAIEMLRVEAEQRVPQLQGMPSPQASLT